MCKVIVINLVNYQHGHQITFFLKMEEMTKHMNQVVSHESQKSIDKIAKKNKKHVITKK